MRQVLTLGQYADDSGKSLLDAVLVDSIVVNAALLAAVRLEELLIARVETVALQKNVYASISGCFSNHRRAATRRRAEHHIAHHLNVVRAVQTEGLHARLKAILRQVLLRWANKCRIARTAEEIQQLRLSLNLARHVPIINYTERHTVAIAANARCSAVHEHHVVGSGAVRLHRQNNLLA